MNTGVQRSGATPPAARTATTQAVGDHPGNPFGQGKSAPLIACESGSRTATCVPMASQVTRARPAGVARLRPTRLHTGGSEVCWVARFELVPDGAGVAVEGAGVVESCRACSWRRARWWRSCCAADGDEALGPARSPASTAKAAKHNSATRRLARLIRRPRSMTASRDGRSRSRRGVTDRDLARAPRASYTR